MGYWDSQLLRSSVIFRMDKPLLDSFGEIVMVDEVACPVLIIFRDIVLRYIGILRN